MGKLERKLKTQSYDLIDGPVRNHELGQIWRKQDAQRIEPWKEHASEFFKSKVPLDSVVNPSLSVSSSDTQSYNFDLGLSMLEGVLEALNMGELELDVKVSGGKTLTVSYDNAETHELPTGDLFDFFQEAKFQKSDLGVVLYRQLNFDKFLVTSGVILAKNLKMVIETDSDIGVDVDAKLNDIVEAGIEFKRTSERKLEMTADVESPIPVAVRLHRIMYRSGKFRNLLPVTDTRDFF